MYARVTGALFVTATAAGVLSAILLDGHPAGAALLVLVMAAAIAMIPPALYPVLKAHGEARALGYVVARTLEAVLLLPAAVGPLMLVAADDPAAATTIRAINDTYDMWGHASSVIFFAVGVLLLNTLLYRSRLVPRWIAGWALLAVVPYLGGSMLVLLDLLDPSSPVSAGLLVPLAVNEMALAAWLLVRGMHAPVSGHSGESR